MESLKNIFDRHFENVVFDKGFASKVEGFLIRFFAKNDDHVAFFGSGLIGVYPVRWNYSDTDYWWDEIFGIDDTDLQRDLFKHPEIKLNRVVSSDVLNHAMIYTLYRVHNLSDSQLTEPQREKLKTTVMICLNVKFLTSLMARYFPYRADIGVAEKTFNNLTMRFDLKSYGSWGKMITARSKDFVSPKGRYYKAYTQYTNDAEIIRMINDAQGRIRETVKEVTKAFYDTLAKEAKVLSSSSSVELDGVVAIKDLRRQRNQYIRYIKNVINEKDSFYKEPINKIIYKSIPSLTPDFYETLIKQFPEIATNNRYRQIVNRFIDQLLVFSFDLLENNNIKTTDLSGVIYRLKHVFMSGRITDELLLKARYDFDKIVGYIDPKMKNKPIVPERCGLFLYIVIRTLTMNYFK